MSTGCTEPDPGWYCCRCWRSPWLRSADAGPVLSSWPSWSTAVIWPRIAFIMDRIFRKFGLSGKSFIPDADRYRMRCSRASWLPVPSRTTSDRKMTIMTTTFIPCGAKLPIIALVAGAIFGGACVGGTVRILRRYRSNHLLRYHPEEDQACLPAIPLPSLWSFRPTTCPTVCNVLRSMWERGWSFIKKAGTIILLSTIVVWFTPDFGFVERTASRMLEGSQLNMLSWLRSVSAFAWIFASLWASATGRQPLHPSPVWLQRKTS